MNMILHQKTLELVNKISENIDKGMYNDIKDQVDELLNECEYELASQLNSFYGASAQVNMKITDLEKNLNEKDDIITKLEQDIDIKNNNIINLKAKMFDLQNELIENKNEIKHLNDEIESLNRELDACEF